MTLSGICTVSKWNPCRSRDFEHVQMDVRVLVAGEADVAHLAGLLGLDHRLHGAALGEDAVRILEADDLVELQQVDVVGLEPPQRFVDLLAAASLVRPSILVIRKAFCR